MPRSGRRRLLAPEVLQTSAMDCGAAALASLLAGFRIPHEYGQLLEECRTHVDGTSVDTIEALAATKGLDVEQILIPTDHVAATAAPGIVVVRRHNLNHFVIAWRRHGRYLQLMDPATGRRWLRADDLETELYVHALRIPASDWRDFAGSSEFLDQLSRRLCELQIGRAERAALIRRGLEDPGWLPLAALDASTRMASALWRRGGVSDGRDAAGLIDRLTETRGRAVPQEFWSVLPDANDPTGPDLIARGAVVLRVNGIRLDAHATADASRRNRPPNTVGATQRTERPFRELWHLLRRDGLVTPTMLAAAAVMTATAAVLEALLLRGAMELTQLVVLPEHRFVAVVLLLTFVAVLIVVDVVTAGGLLRVGRRLEVRLRTALLERLLRLTDAYFQSRLVSDLAGRAHTLDAVRDLPEIAARLVRATTQLVVTAAAISWLDPESGWLAAAAAALSLAVPLVGGRLLAERDLRHRTQSAALSRHYLDSLIGLSAVRAQAAERAVWWQHEQRLVQWGRSGLQMLRAGVLIETAQLLVGSSCAAALVLNFLSRNNAPGAALLLIYWALSLPSLGREIATLLRRIPGYRNVIIRLLEPMRMATDPERGQSIGPLGGPVEIRFESIDVKRSGQQVLTGVDLQVRAGEHVAIVGRSGAGKSTLLGLLLGWQTPASGEVLIDGLPLDAARLATLRQETAWVDPSVQLWNRSLFDNLRYGHGSSLVGDIGGVVETADLQQVLEGLPGGLQATLGENGRLTSGGEGQRVRFARALLRDHVRLALLDEPFRGLDHEQRTELLARARHVWRNATLLCVTHDISDTLAFERVLVVDDGRIVEDGHPGTLSRCADSLFARLLQAERAAQAQLSTAGVWKRWELRDGRIADVDPRESDLSWKEMA